MTFLDAVKFDAAGLVAAVAQDAKSGRVLMLAWMNKESLALTIQSGYATYWSRSRQRLWKKGEESGHLQKVLSVQLDCDGDAVLLQVEQVDGVACHTGRESCFYRVLEGEQWVDKLPVLKDPDTLYNKR